MKFIYAFISLLLAAFPDQALACTCVPLSVNATMYSDNLVFRGTVIRQVDLTPKTSATNNNTALAYTSAIGSSPLHYLVKIDRVFKGCTVKPLDRIVVSSNANVAMCGMTLALNTNYVFVSISTQTLDASIRAALGNRSKVTKSAPINSCGLNREWGSVSEADKTVIRAHKKKCTR